MIRRSLAVLALVAAPFSAGATTIGFEGLDSSPSQTVPITTFSEGGFTFRLTFLGDNNGPAVFDTTCPATYTPNCNTDPDLFLDPGRQGENGVSGNVLILQDDTGDITPDDDVQAGLVLFELLSGPSFRLLGASVIDDVDLRFRDVQQNIQIGRVNVVDDNGTGQNSMNLFPVFRVGDQFSVRWSGSGGLDSLQLAAVPIPAALPMMLAGLAGLGWAARRRGRA